MHRSEWTLTPFFYTAKKKVISNDELLYDPDLDDKDEEWVSKQIDSKIVKKRDVLFSS